MPQNVSLNSKTKRESILWFKKGDQKVKASMYKIKFIFALKRNIETKRPQ